MTYDIEITETVPGEVLELHRSVRADRIGTDLATGLSELYGRAAEAGLRVTGPPSVTYADRLVPGTVLDVDLSVPIAPAAGRAGVGPDARVTGRRAVPVARTVHHGAYDGIGAAYEALEKWLGQHDFQSAGPPTETYVVGPDATADPTGYRTQVHLPVAPALGPTVRLPQPVAVALELTKEALRANGFGVLSEIDVRAVLRDRIGAELEDYVILGVCEPNLAKRALEVDRQVGLLLPCTVVVRADGDGAAVTAMDPALMVRATGHADLAPIAAEARARLDAALAALDTSRGRQTAVTGGNDEAR